MNPHSLFPPSFSLCGCLSLHFSLLSPSAALQCMNRYSLSFSFSLFFSLSHSLSLSPPLPHGFFFFSSLLSHSLPFYLPHPLSLSFSLSLSLFLSLSLSPPISGERRAEREYISLWARSH